MSKVMILKENRRNVTLQLSYAFYPRQIPAVSGSRIRCRPSYATRPIHNHARLRLRKRSVTQAMVVATAGHPVALRNEYKSRSGDGSGELYI